MTDVTVLFARSDSIYRELNCDVWDMERDARLYSGSNPVIAHPPCRAWGQFRAFAKPRPGERVLALIAIEWVRRNGGVLENPLQSRLFPDVIGFPTPSSPDAWGGWLLPFDQSWGGHRARKRTHLYICGVTTRSMPPMPFALNQTTSTVELMSKKERESTPRGVAEWLVSVARACGR